VRTYNAKSCGNNVPVMREYKETKTPSCSDGYTDAQCERFFGDQPVETRTYTRQIGTTDLKPCSKGDYCQFNMRLNVEFGGAPTSGYAGKAACEKMDKLSAQGYRSIRCYDDDNWESGCYDTSVSWRHGTTPRTTWVPLEEKSEGMWGRVFYKVWFDTRHYRDSCS